MIVALRPVMLALSLTALTSRAEAETPCSAADARLVARAYALSTPMALVFAPEDFSNFMAEYGDAFSEQGTAIRCLHNASESILRGALQRLPEPEGGSAIERWGAVPGAPDLTGQVDQDMASMRSNPAVLGLELAWLARVLPVAAQGDFTGFERGAGSIYRESLWQAATGLAEAAQLWALFGDIQFQDFYAALFRDLQPTMEEQIYAQLMSLP